MIRFLQESNSTRSMIEHDDVGVSGGLMVNEELNHNEGKRIKVGVDRSSRLKRVLQCFHVKQSLYFD